MSGARRKPCLQKDFDEATHERVAQSTERGVLPAREKPADSVSVPAGFSESHDFFFRQFKRKSVNQITDTRRGLGDARKTSPAVTVFDGYVKNRSSRRAHAIPWRCAYRAVHPSAVCLFVATRCNLQVFSKAKYCA